jgi:hypothetical protein
LKTKISFIIPIDSSQISRFEVLSNALCSFFLFVLSFQSLVSFQQQQPTISSAGPSIANGRMTPFIAPNSQSFSNGLLTSMDQRMSPLTIGASDQIPIAVAFQETIHVMMSGDDQTK